MPLRLLAFILRRKNPHAERPYKAFGFPILPYLYLLELFSVIPREIQPGYSLWGLGIVLIGIPLYYLAIKIKKSNYFLT